MNPCEPARCSAALHVAGETLSDDQFVRWTASGLAQAAVKTDDQPRWVIAERRGVDWTAGSTASSREEHHMQYFGS